MILEMLWGCRRMDRLKYLNKLAKNKNIFSVERVARGHYVICKYYQDYVNLCINAQHCNDLNTLSFEQTESDLLNNELL